MRRKKKMTSIICAVLIAGLAAALALWETGSTIHVFFSALESEPESECGAGALTAGAVADEGDIVIRQGNPESSKTAITCNVDWGEDVLPEILDILKERNVKITFFVSGRWAEKNPELFRKMYLAGHEIQSHGYRHRLCSKISEEEVREEVEKTSEVFEKLICRRPTVFAPPSGDYDEKTVKLCRELGYRLSLWSADTIDWRPGSTAEIIKNRVMKKDLHGGIILMHPKPETVKALPELLDEMKRQGLSVVPLAELGVY